MRLAAILLVACGIVAPVRAEIRVTATLDPPQVLAGQSSSLSVAVEGAQSSARPELGDTADLQVRYSGPASQVSIVNGRVSTSVTHTFTVLAVKPGKSTIGPITVVVDGTRYDAGKVVLDATSAAAPTAPAAAGTVDAHPQLELTLTVPRTEVYLRERVPLTVKLTVGTVRVGDLQFPAIPGDGIALEKFPEPAQRRENGPRGVVQVVEFRTTLTPQKTGSLTLGPATMGMNQMIQNRHRGGFFDFFGEEARPIQLESAPVTLTVLPLPTAGRPPEFSGAVGRFTYDVTVNPLAVAVGDPVTVRMVVRGEGTLDGLVPPSVAASDRWRTYPTQTTQGSNDERAFEQVVIPLRDGPLPIPPPRWAYFDPTAHSYRIVAPAEIPIQVRPSATAQAAPEIVGTMPGHAARPARPATLGRDLVFIKDAPGSLRPLGERVHRHPWWWLVQLLPMVAWAITLVVTRHRDRLAGDSRFARFTRAGREARAALERARATLAAGDVGHTLDAVANALRDYLAAKLDLPPGSVPDAAPACLHPRTPGTAAQVASFFDACQAARFAPGGTTRAELERLFALADGIVRACERTRGLSVLPIVVALVVASGAVAADETPSALFFRGNALYSQDRHADAAAAYRGVLAAGVESGAVHFNLGNAYFKAGDVGHAVLAYERARRLIPGDPDLHANLAYAAETSGDASEPSALVTLAFPLAHRFDTETLAWATAIAWWIAWLAVCLTRLVPSMARLMRPIALVGALGVALGASSGFYRWWTLERPTFAVVLADGETPIRAEPSPTATTLFATKAGTVVTVSRTRDAWLQVVARDGRRGWVEGTRVEVL